MIIQTVLSTLAARQNRKCQQDFSMLLDYFAATELVTEVSFSRVNDVGGTV